MLPRPVSTLSVAALLVALFALGWVFAAAAGPGTTTTRMPSERNCLLAWNARSNEAGRHRLLSSGPWKAALLADAVVGTVTIPPSPSARVRSHVCALLVRDGSRARQVVGRWRNGQVTEWTFSRVFQLTVRVVRSNVRILHDGRVTKIYRR
jgi:hypothetical protein